MSINTEQSASAQRQHGPASVGLFHVDHDRAQFATSFPESVDWQNSVQIQRLLDEVIVTRQPLLKMVEQAHEDDYWLAVPAVFADRVRSIVLFRFREEMFQSSAMEIWRLAEGRAELILADGCYGNMNHFREISGNVRFPIGVGLPGMTWSSSLPRLLKPLGSSQEFVRASDAATAGLEIGVGFPILGESYEVQSVLLLLSTAQLPFANEMQIWTEQPGGFYLQESMNCQAVHEPGLFPEDSPEVCEVIRDLVAESMQNKRIVVETLPEPYAADGTTSAPQIVVLPVLSNLGTSSALVLLIF